MFSLANRLIFVLNNKHFDMREAQGYHMRESFFRTVHGMCLINETCHMLESLTSSVGVFKFISHES